MSCVLRDATPFPAAQDGAYHEQLAALQGRRVSGVYAILTDRTVLYVGESHTGRLYDTITRHFRSWTPRHDPQGRRRGGTTYDRSRVLVMYAITAAGEAQDAQYEAIQQLRPRDNEVDGSTVVGEEMPPF